MILVVILSILVGTAIVVQSGLNRMIGEKEGLATALHLGNVVVLCTGAILLTLIPLLVKNDFTELLKFRFEPKNWSWWYVIPGICGLMIITITPYAIHKVGAAKIFVAIIGAQVVVSLIWDYFVNSTPLDLWRVVGGILTCAGAVALSLSKGA